MLFNSIDFLFFFPAVMLVYFIIPKRARYIWLLIASYYFYMAWNPKYAILMGLSTIVTWGCSIIIDYLNKREKISLWKKWCVAINIIVNLSILFLFKYGNFAIESVNTILQIFHISVVPYRFDFLLPVGISFYTFQALGYSIDVYRGKIQPEKNLLRYALFVSFFPQLVAGPIERSEKLLPQIQKLKKIDIYQFDQIRDGFFLMMWGLFQKLVIADRMAIIVNQIYDNYNSFGYGFVEIAMATVLFAFQIYCDFGGYTNIARGAARIMGISLMQNFQQPYLATSIKDFWRRWHISLTTWFTDYLYIPLGGNRKGVLRKYINIMIVFLASGLWHGASWNFVMWGGMHAAYQIIDDIWHKKVFQKIAEKATKLQMTIYKVLGGLITFLSVCFAWIFFRADNLTMAFGIIGQMFHCFSFHGYGYGLEKGNILIGLIAIALLLIVDVLHEKGISLFSVVHKQPIVIRWLLYLGLIWCIILFGIYGHKYDATQFIYFQF